MSFSKIKYNSGEEIFEAKIKDSTGALLENWVFMKKDFQAWVKIMEKKYGIKSKEQKIDRDLEWLS